MRFLGFYWFEEWDGTITHGSCYEQYADLADYLKYGVSYWVYILYSDGLKHKVDRRYWESLNIGLYNPNPIGWSL